MNKLVLIFLPLVICSSSALAQDTLPKFTVKNIGNNRMVIGWTNTFETVKQISIQRSFDSTTNYKTILTVPDATTVQNGYVDTRAPNDHMFYRLYILLDKGVFLFSDAKKPVWDTAVKRDLAATNDPKLSLGINYGNVSNPHVNGNNNVQKELWVPSKHVYTYRDGYIRVTLPEEDKKYNIKFFTDDDRLLFELKDIKEKSFRLDKSNFYSAGWFKFELYEDGELKEKNKFYLGREF